MPAIVPTCTRTMAIFDIFAREQRDLSNSDVARLLGIAETSCLDLLHTLVEAGYLARTARSRRFYPTGRLLTIAKKISENDPIFSVASDAVDLLVEKTGETALSGRMEGGVVKIVAIREGKHELRYIQKIGGRIVSHASALGKALLAAGPEVEVAKQLRQRPLKQLTTNTITDVDELERVLEQIRRQGWSSMENEGAEGVSAIAVAGFVGDECIALSLAGPTERFRANKTTYVKALREVQATVFSSVPPLKKSVRKKSIA